MNLGPEAVRKEASASKSAGRGRAIPAFGASVSPSFASTDLRWKGSLFSSDP